MACVFKCDNCGKEERAFPKDDFKFEKPLSWFADGQGEDFILVCSLACAEKFDEEHPN